MVKQAFLGASEFQRIRCGKERFGEEKRFSSLRGDSGQMRRRGASGSAKGTRAPMDKIAKRSEAYLVIDMLNDFILSGAPLEVPKAREIIPKLKEKIVEMRNKKIPIIYICDNHRKNDPEFKIWPAHCVKGTKGAEIVEELKPEKDDYVVTKTTYSGFFKTKLEYLLKRLKVKKLMVSGILTNICVLYTVSDAVLRGYEVEVVKDCVTSLTEEEHNFALQQMEKVLKTKII
jgi:nicotinamidase-related amidase